MGDLSNAAAAAAAGGSPAAMTSQPSSRQSPAGTPGVNTSQSPRRPLSGLTRVSSASRCHQLLPQDHPETVFLAAPDPSYMCPVCDQAMRYPVKLGDCGHRCCSGCLVELVRVAPRCPVDQTKFEPNETTVDKELQQTIDKLAVKCSFHAKGCNWTATLSELQNHAEQCNFYPVVCTNGCGAKFERCFLEKHLVNDCANRLVPCDFCTDKIKVGDEVERLRTCPKFVTGCPNGCDMKKDLLREQLEAHLSAECPKQVVDCPFHDAGCSFKSLRRELADHLYNEVDSHQTLVVQTLTTSAKSVVETEAEFDARLTTLQERAERLVIMYQTPLHWCVEGWASIYRKAKAGGVTSISSPLVATGRNGYRFSLVVYPFGHDSAQGSFMSVFLTLMQSEMDELLDWPFTRRVSITLLDQSDDESQRRHVTHVIDPSYDLDDCMSRVSVSCSSAFERRSPFGVSQFIHLELLNAPDKYIRDDVVFFGVSVDD